MRIFYSMVMLFLLLGPAALPAAELKTEKNSPNLTILADEGMLLPLAQISRLYAHESQTPLTIIRLDPETAQQQIEQGLEAHLVISSNLPLITQLSTQGLTDVSSRKTIARTQLALVTANALNQQANLAKRISFTSILAATPTLPVLAMSPDTYEGKLVDSLREGKPFSESLASRLIVKSSDEDMLAALRETPSLGLMLAAQAVEQPDLTVLSLLSDEISPAVQLDAVVLGSELMGESKAFANYLGSRPARGVFKQFGYQLPTP
jgi:ABC-type molybdate transport system substrate-binding protein